MARIFWIAGLCIAVFVYGGLALGSVIYAVWHRHITFGAVWNVLALGTIAYESLAYMRVRIRQRPKHLVPHLDESGYAVNQRFP